jgi:type IV secretion system protein VirD4
MLDYKRKNIRKEHDDYRYSMYIPKMVTGSRWANPAEVMSGLKAIELGTTKTKTAGLPIISDGKTVYVDDLDNHSLILGSTGSKKTRLFCMPLINLLGYASESMIISDPKGELYDKTSGYLSSQGYQIQVLNFREPGLSSMMWNPLYIPYRYYKKGNYDKATEMVSDFVNTLKGPVKSERDPYWEITASNYILGIIILLFEIAEDISQVNMKSVVLMASYAHDTNELELSNLAKFVKELPRHAFAAIKMLSTLLNADNTRKSILGTVDTMLSPFMNSQQLTALLSKSTFDSQQLGLEKTAIYLIIPDEKTTLHFLATAFIKQSYELLVDLASSTPQRTLNTRVNFVLDEFANMPKVTDMPSIVTAARSRNMRFFLIVQSDQQLFNIYKEEAQTLKGNCTNWVFLTSREHTLLKEVEGLCGKRNVFDREEPLISVTQLQMLDKQKGQTLILQARNYPFVSYLADIDDYELFKGFQPINIEHQTFPEINFFDFDAFYERYQKGLHPINSYFKHESNSKSSTTKEDRYGFLFED